MKKRFLTAVISLVCAAITLLPCALRTQTASAETAPQETSGTPIDVYLIGGQSNAVGCSEIVNNRTETFENVWYAGEIERYVKEVEDENGNVVYETNVAQDWLKSFSDFKRFVTGGYGYHSTSIGPEYGMAKVFNEQYTEGKRVLIFKTAYGGTFLHGGAAGANWCSPSLWRKDHKPDTTKPAAGVNAQGYLYQAFIENFEHVYNELVANGFDPQIKGMAWMQGEADAGEATARINYSRNMRAFITDIRADVAKITGDPSMAQMPFVIGRIAKSFMQWDNPNTTMISEIQQGIADSMDNVYAVNTDDLIIVKKGGKINGSGGWDNCHYNFKDMITLGQRFAETLNTANAEPTEEPETSEAQSNGTFGFNCAASATLLPMLCAIGIGTVALLKKRN